MSTLTILLILLTAVALLLFMVLKLNISAFISLLVTAIYVGIAAGMPLKGACGSSRHHQRPSCWRGCLLPPCASRRAPPRWR